MTELRTETTSSDGTVVIAFHGELDMATATQAEGEIRRVQDARPELLVLDLRGLTFMDSTGLRLVLGADQRARRDSVRLALTRGPEVVQRVFRLALLEERIAFVDQPEDAG